MDNKFTEQLGNWLNLPESDRDYRLGVEMLLKLSGNLIMYRNLSRAPKANAEFIEARLRKYYNFRVQKLTHTKVKQMEAEVQDVVNRNIPLASAQTTTKGRRDDHDALPDEIKALYEENHVLLRRMREVHLRLRLLSTENATCPDSERYPFLKELIELDKKIHANWEAYDTYILPRKKTARKKKAAE